MAVLAIIGILSAIAAPGWLTFANRQRANRATDQVLQSIRSAQADAKRTRRTRTLKFVEDGENTYFISNNGISSKIGEGDLDGMVVLQALEAVSSTDSSLTGTKLGDKPIEFASTGGIDNVDLPVHITVAIPNDDGVKRCIIVRSLLGATQTGKDSECAFITPQG